ncbi:MAG: DEAD/DEAH box helicase [Nitrospira sp.]|nr:DEAD/DEAH box helicase [Nitrospira sp.]
MDVFSFRNSVIRDYETFSRSFTRLRASDITEFVDSIYQYQRFWPAPLIQLNPNFVPGRTVEQLVADGILHRECATIFRSGKKDGAPGNTLLLHKHQEEAIITAKRGESYVLTTGTGSGKSLSYFIPIVDAVLEERKAGSSPGRIRAIVIYPMNALCNSQREELEKFLVAGYGEGREPVTFGRYTGQESREERARMASNPPDILLTNFMMLELLATRHEPEDQAIRKAASGLRFLVLDELHTYRGRQGADVALLVRRVKEACNPDLLCVGTSATMASEGDAASRRNVVASVASRLFGSDVSPDNVITETLQRVTPEVASFNQAQLRAAIESPLPKSASYDQLRQHLLASWIESNIGLTREEGKWVRAKPKSLEQAGDELSAQSGAPKETCVRALQEFLLLAYYTRDAADRSLFAFRLHQFISGAGSLFATLEPEGQRFLTIQGQQFKPGDRSRRLFNAVFCRECGQEYFPVWATAPEGLIQRLDPRELSDTTSDDDEMHWGYFVPDPTRRWNPEDIEQAFPEAWLEMRGNGLAIKSGQRRYVPRELSVDTAGNSSEDGLSGWYIPGSFKFCLNPECEAVYSGRVGELTKLSTLSTEGRSSATTILTLSALRHLLEEAGELPPHVKKLLGFTDNRQDASLQAGHFNDFIHILLLRGALIAALRSATEGYLADDSLTQSVFAKLNLEPADYASNPAAEGLARRNMDQALRDVLGYRLYSDLRRGWRVTNPNLEQLGLLRIDYLELDNCCKNPDLWQNCHPLLAGANPGTRYRVARELLETMRRERCVKTTYLDHFKQEQIRLASSNYLREPWGFSEDERLMPGLHMVAGTKPPTGGHDLAFYVSSRSRFGRFVRSAATWGGAANPQIAGKIRDEDFDEILSGLLQALTRFGIVEPGELSKGITGYRVNAGALKWLFVDEKERTEEKKAVNRFFQTLYLNVSKSLMERNRLLHRLEAREHTAQVETAVREEREKRFRVAELPVLFCSPTMELGVDIAQLNTVYMRNVPPTPANYAQRSGRAGRSGQPALVITYCAARSPHDQYFFSDPVRMVSGVVSPPTLDLANEELIRSHLHAVWLEETGQKLEPSINGILDMQQADTLPVRADIYAAMDNDAVRTRVSRRAIRILDMLRDELTPTAAPWYREDWLDRTIRGAHLAFSRSLDRWRGLYKATVRQMNAAHAIQINAAASEKERDDARQRYNEAVTQQKLLLSQDTAALNSDFYTYRYLASQGFLPGYNFPRLPLLAYIPARRERIGRESFLSRPRFLALSEFGPQSVIYHEGSQYRVNKLIIGVRDQEGATTEHGLPVKSARVCPSCGYGHFDQSLSAELCVSCGANLTGAMQLSTLYRVENVSTRRITRITSDEEERLRQGYDLHTTLQFAQDNGQLQVLETRLSEGGEPLLRMQYGPAATVWRLNLGWRRRKHKTIYGFLVDTNKGYWSRDQEAPDEAQGDDNPNGTQTQRIVPYVEDRRNVLIVSPATRLDAEAMTTLQHALKRGIEAVYQLEESELMAEPLPNRDTRNAILLYESAEGGAGVLTRLATSEEDLHRVAVRALEICHYQLRDQRAEPPLDDMANPNSATPCEAGCYRCLLSYYNQPEHDLINRRNEQVVALLCRLSRASAKRSSEGRSPERQLEELKRLSTSSLEQAWLHFINDHGYLLPDRAQPLLHEHSTQPDFGYSKNQALVYIDGPHHDATPRKQLDQRITERLENAGFTVIRFPKDQASWPAIVAKYPDVFGGATR